MRFASLPFLAFLAAALLLYYAVPKRAQWTVLLAASLGFYAAADLRYLPFLLATVASTHLLALRIASRRAREEAYLLASGGTLTREERKAYRGRGRSARLRLLACGLAFNFGILGVLKYTGFALSVLNGVLSRLGRAEAPVPSLLLPLGISFYTFRSAAYLIDVYRGKTEAIRNPARYALFVSFFPAVIQGPISRSGNLTRQFFEPHRPEWTSLSAGFLRMLWGFFKKLVVADAVMTAVQRIADPANALGGMYAFLLVLLYSAVIYGDFTGGMDIALGVSRMFGVTLEENFNRPFSSPSAAVYWKRWHITMGTWFTDYVFYPLSVCRPVQALTRRIRRRCGRAAGLRFPVYLSTMVTWFLTGLWHGASWNFIVWGLLNGAVILISRECEPLYARFRGRFPRLAASAPFARFRAARTFLLMGLIRILDCYRDVPAAARAALSMVTDFSAWGQLFDGRAFEALGLSAVTWAVFGLSVVLMSLVGRAERRRPVADRLSERPAAYAACCAGLTVCVLLFGRYGLGYDAADFIYGAF